MPRTLIKDTPGLIGQSVLLKGWVNTRRDHGKIVFLDLRDRTGLVQIVADPGQVQGLHPEDVIYVTGTVNARPDNLVNPRLETGRIEIQAEKVDLIVKAAEMPFDMSQPELDLELPTLLDYRSLTLRHPKIRAIFKVQEVVIDSFRRSLRARDFLEFQAPSIISSVPEGGAEVFKVQYYDHQAYLSQSPQLYKSLLVGAFERVFSVNKVFRAEPSVTTRHLTEVVSLDAEFGFLDSWRDVLELQEYVVRFILREVSEKCFAELKMYGAAIPLMPDRIPVLRLRDAQQIIFERTGRDCRTEKDLAPEDERDICKWALETQKSDFVFISHFLTKKKPFYVYPDPDDPEYAFSVDLLCRGIEWSSGGQRLHDYRTILAHIREWGLSESDVELYLQSFRFAVPPLGGFALGAERITMQILGLSNIREAAMFPRDMERIDTRFSAISGDKSGSGEKVFSGLTAILDEHHVKYQVYDHEAVFTSQDAARVRGTGLDQGAKALVMLANGNPLMTVLSAARKVDTQKLKKLLKVKDLRLANADEVIQITGLKIGSIPPFGSLFSIPTYVDKSLADQEVIVFNAGLHTRSIKIKYSAYVKAEKPQVGDFSA